MAEVIACHSVDHWNEQINKSKESNKVVVIDFTASWCPPCRFIAPIFTELASKFSNIIFVKIDVDELKGILNLELKTCDLVLQSVAQDLSVEAMPTFAFLKDGVEIPNSRIVGADKDALVARLEKLSLGQTI